MRQIEIPIFSANFTISRTCVWIYLSFLVYYSMSTNQYVNVCPTLVHSINKSYAFVKIVKWSIIQSTYIYMYISGWMYGIHICTDMCVCSNRRDTCNCLILITAIICRQDVLSHQPHTQHTLYHSRPLSQLVTRETHPSNATPTTPHHSAHARETNNNPGAKPHRLKLFNLTDTSPPWISGYAVCC